jgi:hypothetical protein
MHGPINVKSPNNTSKWQMGFNSAFKGLILAGLVAWLKDISAVRVYLSPYMATSKQQCGILRKYASGCNITL